MLVMRRDLAACKERSGQLTRDPAPTQPITTDTRMDTTEDQQQEPDAKPDAVPVTEPEQPAPMEDVVMEDAKPAVPEVKTPQDSNPTEQPSEQSDDAKPQQPSKTDLDPVGDDAKTADTDLHIDTKAVNKVDPEGKSNDDEKAPDTAAETNNDLDSLFNDDTMSAGGMAADAGDYNFDQDGGNIDFGDFAIGNNDGADNDNISSLLPGLEDYANTQSNEVDLDQLFNLNSNDDNGMNAQGAGEQGDSFEDLLAGFDGDVVDENPNGTANQDFDFDSLFS